MMNASPAESIEFDLSEFSRSLKAKHKYRPLVGKIEAALSACSANEDLRSCLECLRDLRIVTDSRTAPSALGDDTLGTMSGALTAYSIILYCRATQTSTGNRRGWFGLEILNDQQRALHQRIKQLRDNAIAHFGFGHEHPEGPLIREALILSFTPPGPRPIFHSSWMMNKARFTEDFVRLVEHVQEAAREKAHARMNAVMDEIAAIGSSDASLTAAIKMHPFDARAFFLSAASRNEVYSALESSPDTTVHVVTKPKAPGK
jgi:hypothetical protein